MCHVASAAEACALRDQSIGNTQSVASWLGSQSAALLPWAAGIMPAGQRAQTAFSGRVQKAAERGADVQAEHLLRRAAWLV